MCIERPTLLRRKNEGASRVICAMLPHCAIRSPKKNHVGFRISHVKLETPTVHTANDTIHSRCGNGGMPLSETANATNIPQNTAKPKTPCSTRTERNVLCAGGAGSASP